MTQKTRRTIIRIIEIREKDIVCLIPSWNPHKKILFPLDVIPLKILDQIKKDNQLIHLFAFVNTSAINANDLIIEKETIEIAPPLNDNDFPI